MLSGLVAGASGAGARPAMMPAPQIPATGEGRAILQEISMETDYLQVLGTYWGEQTLRDFLLPLGISDTPRLKSDDWTGFLQNYKLGIELTFKREDWLDVALRDYPKGALVLANIRFYGTNKGLFRRFEGQLPLGVRFGDSREALIEILGPDDPDVSDIRKMRWQRDTYCLFATLSESGTLIQFSLQLPLKRK
jgi:hypothetical protein